MALFEDEDDDIPAIELDNLLTVEVVPELKKRDLKKGKHGPSIIRENPIVSSIYDAGTQRIYVGMSHGDVIYWDFRLAAVPGEPELQVRSHSAHRTVGQHAVRSRSQGP